MKIATRKKPLAPLSAIMGLLLWGCAMTGERDGSFGQDALYEALVVGESITVPEDLQPRLAGDPDGVPADGSPLALSIEQAILLALRNNQDLRVKQLNPIIAGTFAKIERGVYDPEFFAELEFNSEKSSETDPAGNVVEVEEDGHAAVIGLRKKLAVGATVEASVGQDRSTPDTGPEEQTARLGLSITQSLLRGFGPAVNLVRVQQAELNAVASAHELRGLTEALLADTETAYWDFVLARDKIDIFENSLAIARQQLDEVRQRIEVGILPRIEEAAAHAEEARRQQALIDARSQLEESRLRLLRMVNPGGDGRLDLQVIAVSNAPTASEPINDLAERLELASRARPELNETRLRRRQQRLETVMTRNGLLPKLDLFISLGKTGYGESFSDSFRNLDQNSHDLAAGIRLSHALGNNQAEARDLAALATWQQSAEALQNLEQLVALDVRLAVNEVERSRQLIGATRATRILQEETLAAEKERFDVGATTALLVAQAQRDLLFSSIVEVEAVVSYRQALVALYLAEGSLLERRGVRLGGAP